jgi:cytochrome c-type biogenesis protein CcmF
MNLLLGRAGVTLGLVSALLGVTTIVIGLVRRESSYIRLARWYVLFVVAGATLAVIAMQRALITNDFTVKFVSEVGSTRTPFPFNVAAMWSALEGSILLWALILSGYTVMVARKFRSRLADPLVAWAVLTMLVVCAFFFALMAGPANPFRSVTVEPGFDGPGPNPLLQNNVLMAFHPPMLYLGYVGFTVPFAFAIAALATGRVGEGWLVETRRWTLFAWGFLSFGIVLGAWWSYEVLGWGGYWAWDPVENASLLPWITGTAFIHSVMVQERRGMLRVWNLSLVCATFALTILGTFITRSGVLRSVHAFTESGIGPMLIGFFSLIIGVTVGLIAWRGDRLRSPGKVDSPVSREGAFLANNVLFGAFAFVVLLGTVFPLLMEALNGQQITVGAPYFARMAGPIGFSLLFLMAVAPVLPWRKASGELLRERLLWPAWIGTGAVVVAVALGARGLSPLLAFGLAGFAAGSAGRQLVLASRRQGWRGLVGRANGGMVVHIGIVLIAVGIAASSSYGTQSEPALAKGATATVAGHTVQYLDRRETVDGNRTIIAAEMLIDGHGPYAPALEKYGTRNELVAKPDVRSTPVTDVMLALLALPEKPDDPVSVRVIVQPMVMWLWIGGALIALGTLLAAIPSRLFRRPTDPVSAPIGAGAGTSRRPPAGPAGGDATGDAADADTDGASDDEVAADPDPVAVP